MATFNTSSSAATSSVNSVIEFLLPGLSMKKTERNAAYVEKKELEVEARRLKLAEFFKDNNINPLPTWGKTLLTIGGKNKLARLPKSFYKAMEQVGTEWYGARIKREKGQDIVKGCKLSLSSIYKTIPYEEGMVVDTTLTGSDVPKLLASHLASEFSKLTAEQYAQLVAIFCFKAEVSGSVISIIGSNGTESASTKLVIDFNSKEVRSRSDRKANELVQIANKEYDSKFALFVLAIQLCTSTSTSRINATLAELPNLWERSDNYGAKMKATDPTRVTLDYLCLPLTFSGTKKGIFPFIKLENDQFDCSSIASITEPVAVDKYAKQWVTLRKGAQAMMIGRSGDIVLSPHDGGKAAKEYNRPTQGMKFLKADSPNRVFSKLRIDLGDNTYAIPEGIMLMTAFTNSRLGAGSGVSFVKPGTKIHHQVEKTLTGQVTTLRVPSAIRAKMANLPGGLFENLKTAVTLQCEKLVGKSFAPGQLVLGMFGGKYEIIRNDNHNQTLTVTAVDIRDLSAIKGRADSFQVKLSVLLDEHDDCLKFRNMGIKLTTLPYPVKGLRDDWQLILNNETAKGKLGLVHLFANKYGATYYPNEGLLILDEPCVIKEGNFDCQIVDLKEANNAFTQWVKENTEEVNIQMPIVKEEWEVIKASQPTADDIKVLQDIVTHVVVEERIQVIYGLMPYEVEISTPRENTGTGSLTLEQLAALSLQHKELAETIWEESRKYQSVVKDLVASVLKTDMSTDNMFVLTTQEGREKLRESMKGEFSSDREVLSKLEKAFPQGLVLTSVYKEDDNFVYIKPSVLSKMGSFFGKSASGIALDVLSFLNYLLDAGMENESGIDSLMFSWIEKLSTSLDAWLDSMAKSNGVLKKLGRTSKCLVNGKVKTSYHPELMSQEGLPTIILHPHCAMVDLLGAKDGDIIGIGRTPMVFITACKIKLSTIGRVGHVMLTPSVWAAATEGDSDGDGIFTINLTKRGVTLAEAHTINNHAMGQAGYSLVYGDDVSQHPYAEFVSYSDKWGKKAVNKIGVISRQIPFNQYVENAGKVSSHYSFAVGTSYGICSVLTFYTANLKYAQADKEQLRVAELATVVAWRKIYEGLGLSGYSVQANEFFEILGKASYSKDFTYIMKEGKVDYVSNAKSGETILQAIPKLCELAGINHMADCTSIMRTIIACNQIRIGYSRVENGKKVNDNMLHRAALFGALRRMGQGQYGIDPMEEFSQEAQMQMTDELNPRSTYSIVKAKGLHTQMQCTFLREALTSAVDIHFELAKKWVSDEEAEQFGGM